MNAINAVIADNYSSIPINEKKEDASNLSMNQLEWMMVNQKRRVDYGMDFLRMTNHNIYSLFCRQQDKDIPSHQIPFTHCRSPDKIREFIRLLDRNQKTEVQKCHDDSTLKLHHI